MFSYHCASEIQVVTGCEPLFRSARVKLFCELIFVIQIDELFVYRIPITPFYSEKYN